MQPLCFTAPLRKRRTGDDFDLLTWLESRRKLSDENLIDTAKREVLMAAARQHRTQRGAARRVDVTSRVFTWYKGRWPELRECLKD